MTSYNYNDAVAELQKNIYNSVDNCKPGDFIYRSQLECEANLQKFLGISTKEASEFYKAILFNRDWAIMDEDYEEPLKETVIRGDQTYLRHENGPVIFCTFHSGSYRLINFLLAKNGINFSLVIDDTAVNLQGEKFLRMYDKINRPDNPQKLFNIINAEKQNVGINMIRRIRSGQNLLLYLDGNSGVGGMDRTDDKLVDVQFFGQTIKARKGISYIAHRTSTPIVPVVSYRENGKNVIEILAAIYPDQQLSSAGFSKEATQQLYQALEQRISTRIEQWEGWLYINKFTVVPEPISAVPEGQIDPSNIQFNNQRYHLYKNEQAQAILFDRQSYDYFQISDSLFEVFETTRTSGRLKYKINDSLLKDLLQRNVLLTA